METKTKLSDEAAKPRRKWWRSVLSRLRRRCERMLHPGRRRLAQNRVRSLTAVRSVLFLCEGNIYRSPFAAELLRSMLAAKGLPGFVVGSAGFVGPGRPTPKNAQELATRFGLDLSRHESQLVMGVMLADFDLIVVMEARQARVLAQRFGVAGVLVLGDLDPELVDERTIVDPWQGSQQVLHVSYARILRCVSVLADLLTGSRELVLFNQTR